MLNAMLKALMLIFWPDVSVVSADKIVFAAF